MENIPDFLIETPCPFCEGADIVVASSEGLAWVRCNICEAEGPLAMADGGDTDAAIEKAIRAWKRATHIPAEPKQKEA
jgi:restriction alleviation protein Lar